MKLNKCIIIVSLLLLFCNCTKPKAPFIFDKVEHYSLPENDFVYEKIYQKRFENLSLQEQEYLDMRDKNIPSKINDTKVINRLEKIGYQKKLISVKRFNDLSEIFVLDDCSPFAQNACAPIYRDIYVFKNNLEIVAIAKVCFECEILYLLDSKGSLERFTDCIEFDELKTIK